MREGPRRPRFAASAGPHRPGPRRTCRWRPRPRSRRRQLGSTRRCRGSGRDRAVGLRCRSSCAGCTARCMRQKMWKQPSAVISPRCPPRPCNRQSSQRKARGRSRRHVVRPRQIDDARGASSVRSMTSLRLRLFAPSPCIAGAVAAARRPPARRSAEGRTAVLGAFAARRPAHACTTNAACGANMPPWPDAGRTPTSCVQGATRALACCFVRGAEAAERRATT